RLTFLVSNTVGRRLLLLAQPRCHFFLCQFSGLFCGWRLLHPITRKSKIRACWGPRLLHPITRKTKIRACWGPRLPPPHHAQNQNPRVLGTPVSVVVAGTEHWPQAQKGLHYGKTRRNQPHAAAADGNPA